MKCPQCEEVRTVRVRSFAQSLTGGLCKPCGLEGRGYVSNKETEVRKFLESLGVSVIANDRKTLGLRLELDCYMPDLNLAVEFNGEYYHRDEYIEEKRGMPGEQSHHLKLRLLQARV